MATSTSLTYHFLQISVLKVETGKIMQCLNWFQDATNYCMPVSGPFIQQQALKFSKNLNNDTFNGWFDSLFKRNNIVFKTMTGERGDVDTTTVDDWRGLCWWKTIQREDYSSTNHQYDG